MIKTVLFDLGNVILPFDLSRLAGRLQGYSTKSIEEIIGHIWNDEVANSFETGLMSSEEYFEHAKATCGFDDRLSFEEFKSIFNEIFVEDAEIRDLVLSLKKKYPLAIISNANPIHVPYVVERYDVLKLFDQVWFSNLVRVRKPDPAIFKIALDHFKIAPDEAVFMDDLLVNVEAARKVGINAIHYLSPPQLKQELSKLGVTY